MQALLRKIRQILKDRRTRRFFTRAVSSVAAIVVFVTTYALILPAITLEKTASCGIEEHQHSDSCYEAELVCGQEESDGHHHDGSCYSIKTELSCESREHQHSAEDGCYDADGNLVCELQEHVHDDSCYEEVRTLTCGQAESKGHHHTDACYEKVLVCGKEVHTHSEKCYGESGSTDAAEDDASVGMPSEQAGAGASGNTGNITDPGNTGNTGNTGTAVPEASDSTATAEAAQPDSYVPELDPVDMEAVLNSHTDFYYFHAEEGEEVPANSTEIADWRKVEEDTTLTSTDLVKVYFAYTIPAGSLNETNPSSRYRLPDNIHLSDKQIEAMNRYENGIAAGYKNSGAESEKDSQEKGKENYEKYLGAEAIEGDRRPDEQLRDGAQEYISAAVRAENVYDDNGKYIGQDLIFTFAPYSIEKNRDTYNVDKTLVSAGKKITGWFACDLRMDQIDWEQEDNNKNGVDLQEVDQEEGYNEQETEGTADEADSENTARVIFAREDQKKGIKEISRVLKMTGEISDGGSAEAQNEQIFKAGTLTAQGDDYSITLDYGEEAKIPENASLSVREITAETDKEAYEACLEQAGQQVAADDKTSVDQKASRFFDIEIVVTETNTDGTEKTEKIEPSAPVSVHIQVSDKHESTESKNDQSDPTILHFAEEGVEQIDSTVTDSQNNDVEEQKTEIRFEAESFSVYGVVYTVDFHWEVNGKMYEFSIPGGGFVSFYNLVEVLGIEVNDSNTEKDEIQELVDGIESITFSSPELVSVSKVEENTTVGAIKELLNLECEYSAELTEEKIVEINAQEVKAGDWALIALHSFTSEETLMVSMRNGDKFVVRVTDAVFGAFPHDVKIDIVGNGGIELTEYYSDPYSAWDDEERVKTYFSARTVPMSLSYFAYDWTNNVAANNGAIIAHAGQGYVFDHWEQNGQRLTGSQFSTDTIAERTLYFSFISSDTLTAVFRKTNNGGGGGNISIDDIIAQWSTDITNDQPKVDKTASVYDYDDRIYQIDITASSELYAINRDLDIDFVTDVSRSMLFPSKLDKAASVSNANDLLGKLDAVAAQNHNGSIPNRTAQGEYYYLIIKPQTASDVYICRKVNGKWYRNAAANVAYFNDADSTITGLNNGWREIKAHEVNDGTGNIYLDKLTSEYIVDKYIYVATDDTQRIEYLKRALNIVKDVLYKVDPDARIGLTTFAKTANQGQFYTNSQQDQNALANAITNITCRTRGRKKSAGQ